MWAAIEGLAPGDAGTGGKLPVRVLQTSTATLIVLVVMWTLYAAAARNGRELHSLRLSLLCLSFAACSWGMNVLNKGLVGYFMAPSLVTAVQMLITVCGTLLLGWHKLSGSRQQVLKWAFVPLLFFGMLVSSLFTYEYLSLSMLMVVRNVGPLVTLPIERVVMPPEKQPPVSFATVVALSLTLVGAVVYCGAGEVFTWVGLGLALLNMLLAIADRLMQRRLLTTECKGLSNETCVLLNNLLGLLPTLVLSAALGEVAKFDPALWFSKAGGTLLFFSGLVGSGICLFAIAVQREVSATSFMVLQNAVRVAVVLAGMAFFSDEVKNRWHAAGLALSFGGALLYGKVQVEANETRRSGEQKKLLPG